MAATLRKFKYVCGFLLMSALILGPLGAAVMAKDDAKLLDPANFSIYDKPGLTLQYSWLANEKFGVDVVNTVRTGDSIYGCYQVSQTGEDCIVTRTYAISKYKLSKVFSDPQSAGSILYSWGFQISPYIAKNNDNCPFDFIISATGGNTIKKSMKFKVMQDGIVNSSRAYAEPMDPGTKRKILGNSSIVASRLRSRYKTHSVASSPTASSFLTDLNNWLPNAVLIHSHGNSADGGRIYLPDDSYINAADVAAAAFTTNWGLFYAAICEGATFDDLGNAFIAKGFQAFIGYTVSVYTTRNADFYKYFFSLATKPNVSVDEALATTLAWAQKREWDDVATARIIGNGTVVFLGGNTKVPVVTAPQKETAKMTIKVAAWKDIATSQLTAAQMKAVQAADEVEEVKRLREKHGAALTTGLEDFPQVYRVGYKVNNIFIYGVDVDKTTGAVVYQGTLD